MNTDQEKAIPMFYQEIQYLLIQNTFSSATDTESQNGTEGGIAEKKANGEKQHDTGALQRKDPQLSNF